MQLPQMHLPHGCMHNIAPVKQDFLLYLLCCMTILIAAAQALNRRHCNRCTRFLFLVDFAQLA